MHYHYCVLPCTATTVCYYCHHVVLLHTTSMSMCVHVHTFVNVHVSTLMISANEMKTSLHSKISLCKGCLRVGESRRTARASAQVGCACARATSWTLAARSGVFARANENFDRKLWAASFVDFRLTLREGRDSRPAQCAGRPSRGAQRPGRFRRPGPPH